MFSQLFTLKSGTWSGVESERFRNPDFWPTIHFFQKTIGAHEHGLRIGVGPVPKSFFRFRFRPFFVIFAKKSYPQFLQSSLFHRTHWHQAARWTLGVRAVSRQCAWIAPHYNCEELNFDQLQTTRKQLDLLLHDVPADHHDLPEHVGLLLQRRLKYNYQTFNRQLSVSKNSLFRGTFAPPTLPESKLSNLLKDN